MTVANIRYLKVCIVVAAWVGVVLAATHYSDKPVVLGRYSGGYAYLLCLFVGIALSLSLAKSAWYLTLYQARAGLVISVVSLLLSLGVLEVAVRTVDPLGISYYEWVGEYLRDMLPDDQLIYRHKPEWEKRYGNVLVTFNERGLRDRPILSKAEDEYRILALGDSVTFGLGVDQDKTFAARLESLLRGRLHRPVRVINSGVGGYNTVQELTYFKQEGIDLQPDLVLLTYVTNDIEEKRKPFDPWSKSSMRGKPFPVMVEIMMEKLWLYRLAHHTYRYAVLEQLNEKSLARSQNGTGWRGSMSALSELVAICQERKIPLILFFKRLHPDEHNLLFDDVVRNAQGLPVKDMAPWFAGLNVSSFVNSKVDTHPNAEGHRVIAEHMADDVVNYLAQSKDRASLIWSGIRVAAVGP